MNPDTSIYPLKGKEEQAEVNLTSQEGFKSNAKDKLLDKDDK
jgi:hypothetical protein